ncbi:hypothetical protein [Nocardia sp. NPDC004604]|uniref:hypothetical protein n=1 Tax=Nocardia sp. NPDC004604 TaxID=3157013 RepID=UPI0033A9FD1D
MRAFDFEANPNVDPPPSILLATCDWVRKSLPLCLINDSGTGKSCPSAPRQSPGIGRMRIWLSPFESRLSRVGVDNLGWCAVDCGSVHP